MRKLEIYEEVDYGDDSEEEDSSEEVKKSLDTVDSEPE